MTEQNDQAREDTTGSSTDSRTASKVAPHVIAKYLETPWRMDAMGMSVWGRDKRDGSDSKIADIRGWGHLTGRGGGLALSEEVAEAVQRARGLILSAAPDLLEAAKHAAMEWRLHGQLTDSCRVLEAAIAKAEGR